ncbi:hypothetical protein [Bernardetia sp. MNP-M8]|uniref:hypothetical protein n=1 Tax=Bernardetia sp. MNP-M8 TaxID=3127470 RepID=UPI0030CE6B88
MTLISDWIAKTNEEISSVPNQSNEQYHRFVQLYFLLNNLLKKSNLSNPPIKRADSGLITDYLPTYLESNWQQISSDSSIEESCYRIYLSLNYNFSLMLENNFYANTTATSSSPISVIKTQNISYKSTTHSRINYTITDEDFKVFSLILNYGGKYKQKRLKELMEGALKVIYAVRNNYYHGGKTDSSTQKKLLNLINICIVNVIEVLILTEKLLNPNDNTWNLGSDWETIRIDLNNSLQNIVKEKIISFYNNDDERDDRLRWKHLLDEENLEILRLPYYFILLEKQKITIESCTHKNYKDVIDAVNEISNFLSIRSRISWDGLDNKYRNTLRQKRNSIFHGNENSSLEDIRTEINENNEDLRNLMTKVDEFLNNFN